MATTAPQQNPVGNSALTAEDAARLLKDPSPEARHEITEKLASQYDAGGFNATQRELANQLLRLLIHDTEVRVRQTIADTLKKNDSVPHDIVLKIAQDDIESVSAPMLEFSKVLTDADLINIIKTSDQVSSQLAISRRETLNAGVSDALVDTKTEQVVHSLLQNKGANIDESSVQKVVKNHAQHGDIVNSLIDRQTVPIRQMSSEEANKMIQDQYASGQLTGSSALMMLCGGNVFAFSLALSLLANAQAADVKAAIEILCKKPAIDPSHKKASIDEQKFKTFYETAELSENMYTVIKIVVIAVHTMDTNGEARANKGSGQYFNRLIERILEQAEHHEDEDMSSLNYVLTIIRRNTKSE